MYVNYEYYKLFYYVAKYGSLSLASKILSANEPNLSRSIRTLESELGCPLFNRTSKGMSLTDEGKILYERVRVACESIEAGEAEIIASKNLEEGSVSLAVSDIALHCVLLPVLKEYRMLYPGVKLKINNNSTPQAIEAIKNGVADFAVVVTMPIEETSLFVQKTVCKLTEVAVANDCFSELKNRKVSLAEISEYPLVSLSQETGTYRVHARFFADNSLPFSPETEVSTADQILPAVKAGLGIGFVPKEFVDKEDDVFIIDTEQAFPEREIAVIKRKDRIIGIAARELESLIFKSRK